MLAACRTDEALSARIVGIPTLVQGGLSWSTLNDGVAGGGSCALASGGSAYCWGVTLDHAANFGPYTVAGGVTFATISVGGEICALTSAGAAYCWDETAKSFLPVSGAFSFTAMSAGGTSCGLTAGGGVYCWQGTGTPTAVAGAPPFVSVSSGASTTCGLTAAGAAYCWGDNSFGELGAPTPFTVCYPPYPLGRPCSSSVAPLLVGGGVTFSAISAGGEHTCALTAGGAAYCWGSNDNGQLGVGPQALGECRITASRGPALVPDSVPCTVAPTAVAGDLRFTAISAGWSHTCGLADNGSAYCWGANGSGQLGNGSTTASNTPFPVSRGLRFVAIDAASDHTCALTAQGDVYCWGGSWCGSGPGGVVISCVDAD